MHQDEKNKDSLPRRLAVGGRKGRTRAWRPALLALSALALVLAAGCLARAGVSPASAGFAVYRPDRGPLFLVGQWERREGFVDEAGMEAPGAGAVAAPYAEASFASSLLAAPPSLATRESYRLRVDVSAAAPDRSGLRRLAFYAPRIGDFDALIIDGRLAYERSEGTLPSRYFMVDAAGDTVSVLLRAAPGDPRLDERFATPRIMAFGEAGQVDLFRSYATAIAFTPVGFFLLLGVVTFLLFLFWRKNREFLGFSVYMLSAGLYYALKNSLASGLLAAGFLGAAPAALTAALDLQYAALAFFLWTLYGPRVPLALRAAALALPAALAAAAVAAALALPSATTAVAAASLAWSGAFALAVIAWLAVIALRGDGTARWLLPAFCVVGLSFAARRLLPPSFEASSLAEPAGVMVFGLACGLMLVKKVGDSFEAVETLSGYVTDVAATVRSFIPREFLDYLQKDDVVDLRLGDHVKKEMTIFFSDIRAFTELSERLTVEENFAFINSYLSRVVPIIRENGGFVDKYLGDGILALFPGEAGPDEAIRSAIAMQGKILEYNGHRAKMGYRPISMGVGIHTGDLMLGVVGVSDRMENTVISDAVNLSSRLQAITKAFNISVAISEQAFKELEDPGAYTYRFIGKVRVKGKAAPVSVFEIFDGIAPSLFERKMKANTFFEQGMLSYYQKDFAGAMYYFKRVLDVIPEDGAAGFYLENCMSKAAT